MTFHQFLLPFLPRCWMSLLKNIQFAWMTCSRCGLTNELDRGIKISFARQDDNLFMKDEIPLALTLAEGLNAEFTIMPMSSTYLKRWVNSPSSPLERAKRKLRGPPFDRCWFFLDLGEDSICKTNSVLVEVETSALTVGFLQR